MTAQNGPQVSGPDDGSGSGEHGDVGHDTRTIRKYEAMTLISVAGVVGCFAGIGRRTMDHASYWGAITTGVIFAAGLVGFVFGVVRYIRKES
jgi:hypothetical protein